MADGSFTTNGADMTVGDEPELAKRLGALARAFGQQLQPAGPRSGYRTPTQSKAVGGTGNDVHTQAKAVDVNGDWIKTVPNSTLNKYGLNRPLTSWLSPTDGTTHDERNHIQLASAAQDKRNQSTIGRIVSGGLQGANVATGGLIPSSASGVSNAASDAVNFAKDPVGTIVNSLWNPIAAKAKYGGLFVLLIAAGAALVVFGVTRTAGHHPQGAAT